MYRYFGIHKRKAQLVTDEDKKIKNIFRVIFLCELNILYGPEIFVDVIFVHSVHVNEVNTDFYAHKK